MNKAQHEPAHEAVEHRNEPWLYELRIKGHLDDKWADWFEHMSFTHASDGTTILAGPLVDQAALYGLLRKVRDLGLPLIAVNLADPKHADWPYGNVDTDHHCSNKEKNP